MSRESKGLAMMVDDLTHEQFYELCARWQLKNAVESINEALPSGDYDLPKTKRARIKNLAQFAGECWCEDMHSGTEVPEAIEEIAPEYVRYLTP